MCLSIVRKGREGDVERKPWVIDVDREKVEIYN